MADNVVLRTIWSVDRKHWLEIFRRPDGHFGFVAHSQQTEDGDTFWAPTEFSGIYDEANRAEADALLSMPWLNWKPSS